MLLGHGPSSDARATCMGLQILPSETASRNVIAGGGMAQGRYLLSSTCPDTTHRSRGDLIV